MESPKPTSLWIAKKAHFVAHEPCPKCGSRDNLGRYSDGSAWCFGCHHREPPERTITNVRDSQQSSSDSSGSSVFFDADLPLVALKWLKKYGLTNEECQNFLWDRAKERLVVSITRNDKLVFWQGRRFGLDAGPKYLSWGKIPWDPPVTFGDKDPIIFVEDVVSAIKVGHVATGVPLFGSYLPANGLKWASEQRRPLALWLDPDKRREGLRQALQATAAGIKVHFLTADKDPKELSDEEIRRTVGNLFPNLLSNSL